MASEVKWIKIVTDIFDDEKILLIESMPQGDSIIVIWFKLLCLAGKQNNEGVFMLNDRIAYTDEMIAAIFRRPINTVRLALSTFEQFGMIEIINNAITIPKWELYQKLEGMEKIREQTRLRVQKHREKQKEKAVTLPLRNVTQTDIDIDIDIDKDIEDNKNIYCAKTKKTGAEFPVFEQAWRLYPEKKGKSQVSKKSKDELETAGFDTVRDAIIAYKQYIEEKRAGGFNQQYLNGSTFFNGRWREFLPQEEETLRTNAGEPYEINEDGNYTIHHQNGDYTLIMKKDMFATRFNAYGAIIKQWEVKEDELPV